LDDVSPVTVSSLVDEIFGAGPEALIENADFNADIVTVSDSLGLASIVEPVASQLRTRLVQARRAIAVIQALAHGDGGNLTKGRINRLLNAVLLLPSPLFPLPDNSKEKRDENKK